MSFPIDIILINMLVPESASLFGSVLHVDTTCYPVLHNIHAECKDDRSEQAQVLAQRVQKLANIVKTSLCLKRQQWQQPQVDVKNRKQKGDEQHSYINKLNMIAMVDNIQQDQNIDYSNKSKVDQLKRSQYHTVIPMNQYLQYYHPKVYNQQGRSKNNQQKPQANKNKLQPVSRNKTSNIKIYQNFLNQQHTTRNQTEISVSPKVQNNSHNAKKLFNHKLTQQSTISIVIPKQNTNNIQIQTDQPNPSVDILAKLMEQNNSNFNSINKEILGIKQVISEIGESRVNDRLHQMDNSISKSHLQHQNFVQKPADPVEEEELWECQEEELEEEIKAINKQLSSRVLEKIVINKNNDPSKNEFTLENVYYQQPSRHLRNPTTKLVKLNLTPDKPSANHSFNVQIDLRMHNNKSQSKSINKHKKSETSQLDSYAKIQHTPLNKNNTYDGKDLWEVSDRKCGKWEKKDKKKLLSMRIDQL